MGRNGHTWVYMDIQGYTYGIEIALHVTLHSLQLILFKIYVLHGQRLYKRNLSLYLYMDIHGYT